MTDGAQKKKREIKIPKWVDRVFLAVGIGLLAWVISRYPMAELGRACLRLGPWVALTPLIALVWMSCNTTALWLLLGRRVAWLRLLRIRLVGDGYNALLPLAGLGGEPYKVKHLAAEVPVDQVLTALVRDRVVENGVGLLFTGLWLGVGLAYYAVDGTVRVGVVGYVTFAALAGALSLLLMGTSLPGRASARLAKWLGVPSEKAARMPAPQFASILACYLAARFAGAAETAWLLHLLGLGHDPLVILFGYSLLNAAGFIGFAVPAGIGVFEGSTVYLFGVLGFPGPLGVAFALARRGRMLIVGLLGVALHLVGNLRGQRDPVALAAPVPVEEGAVEVAAE